MLVKMIKFLFIKILQKKFQSIKNNLFLQMSKDCFLYWSTCFPTENKFLVGNFGKLLIVFCFNNTHTVTNVIGQSINYYAFNDTFLFEIEYSVH